MKKQLPFILIIIAAIGIGYSFINKPADNQTAPSITPGTQESAAQTPGSIGAAQNTGDQHANVAPGSEENDDLNEDVEDVKPAAVAYKNAEEALDAIKKGAADYDDSVLEQFTTPGEDCTWCPQLYASIKDLLKSGEFKNEQKSFFAEILAISGKTDNVQTLIDSFKGAQSPEEKEIYSSALELVTGKDDVVQFLGTQLKTDNPDLKESIVAAITNQGSPLALETMYRSTVEGGDPDGYYSMGIGLGEMILDDSALPKAQEYAEKRDAYAPLLIKALLNSGINGLRSVMEILGNSTDPEADKRLLKDAVDHVSYDDQIDQYLKTQEDSPKPLVRTFAKQIRDDFNQHEEDAGDTDTDDGEDEPKQSPVNGK